jgi:hypothetical protein
MEIRTSFHTYAHKGSIRRTFALPKKRNSQTIARLLEHR